MKVYDSALKHGVIPEDAAQAADWPLWVEPLDEETWPHRELRLGFDTQARLLETVVLVFESGGQMVIQAMPARKQYWDLLPRADGPHHHKGSPFSTLCHRLGMKVIGAAWGRTGTTTAAAALDILGFGPCVQMQTMWEQPHLAETWAAHYRGSPANWQEVLADFGASVDWPGAWEWQRFAELWPEAKVLLTVRDSASWYDSVLGSIHAWTAPGIDVGPPAVAALLDRIWEKHFGGWPQVFDRARTIERYEQHVAEVRQACEPDRLIEWGVSDGWPPLCEALGADIPDQPLPHLNSRTE